MDNVAGQIGKLNCTCTLETHHEKWLSVPVTWRIFGKEHESLICLGPHLWISTGTSLSVNTEQQRRQHSSCSAGCLGGESGSSLACRGGGCAAPTLCTPRCLGLAQRPLANCEWKINQAVMQMSQETQGFDRASTLLGNSTKNSMCRTKLYGIFLRWPVMLPDYEEVHQKGFLVLNTDLGG